MHRSETNNQEEENFVIAFSLFTGLVCSLHREWALNVRMESDAFFLLAFCFILSVVEYEAGGILIKPLSK